MIHDEIRLINWEASVMKAMKRTLMNATIAAALMAMITGTGYAQRLNESAVASGRMTISSIAPLSDNARLSGSTGASANAISSTNSLPGIGGSPLQLRVGGTLDGNTFSGLWAIDHFEKRGKALYAVGYMINSSLSVQGSVNSGSQYYDTTAYYNGQSYSGSASSQLGSAYGTTYDTLGRSINGSTLGSYDATGSFGTGVTGSVTLGDTLNGNYYGSMTGTADMLSDTIDNNYSGTLNGDIGHNPLSDRTGVSGIYGGDTLGITSSEYGSSSVYGNGINYGNTSSSGFSSDMNSSTIIGGGMDTSGSMGLTGSMSGYSTSSGSSMNGTSSYYGSSSMTSQASTTTLDTMGYAANATLTQVAIPVTIAGASCDALYLRLGTEKAPIGSTFRGVTADRKLDQSASNGMVKISSDDLSTMQSSEALCTISRIVNGDGSTLALVDQLNTLVGAPTSATR
jgi:hypothetical protein